jgi:hypothetical protein
MTNDSNPRNIGVRYRTLFTLWFAICMSVLLFLVLVQFTPVKINVQHSACPDCLPFGARLSLVLNSLAIVPLGISFLIKQRLLAQAIALQKIDMVQSAYVVAFALCEASALLGLLDHFINGSPLYYVGFIFAGLGMLLHFPRKQHLLDASQKQF